jgi:DNA-binding transcriptional LysR family regulator
LAGIPTGDNRFINKNMLQDEMVLAVSKKNLLARTNTIKPCDLIKQPFIIREKKSGSYQIMVKMLQEIGISPAELNIVAVFSSLEAVKSVVELDMGVTIISKYAIRKELLLKSLVGIRIDSAKMKRYVYSAYLKESQLTLPAKELLKMANELFPTF